MQLSPCRRSDEKVSEFRFRYAWFSFKCVLLFAVPLSLLLAIRPEVNQSPMPLLVMALYFGLPIAFGMAVLSVLGFVIGGFFARQIENSLTTRWLWPRVQFVFSALALSPLAVFSSYWLFRGITNLETQALARGGVQLITPHSAPLFFWVSLLGWAVFSFGIPYYAYRRAKQLLRSP